MHVVHTGTTVPHGGCVFFLVIGSAGTRSSLSNLWTSEAKNSRNVYRMKAIYLTHGLDHKNRSLDLTEAGTR
jgi:hypothetical protein